MRPWIAFFLLLLFATQAFPLAALSKSYAKSQVSATDSDDDDHSAPIPKESKVKKQNSLSEEDYDHSHSSYTSAYYAPDARHKLLDRHEYFYALYSGEVTTPPPNFG